MKLLLCSSLITLLGFAGIAHADILDLDLFSVSGQGKTIQYKARVNSDDCSFDQKKPTEEFMSDDDSTSPEKQAGWLANTVVGLDYLKKATQEIVAEVKYLEDKNVHWPVTLTVAKDDSGQCQGTAIGTDSGESIQSVTVSQTDKDGNPTQLMVTGMLQGQPVQTPVDLN